jgi:hypothetical protein
MSGGRRRRSRRANSPRATPRLPGKHFGRAAIHLVRLGASSSSVAARRALLYESLPAATVHTYNYFFGFSRIFRSTKSWGLSCWGRKSVLCSFST